MQAIEHLLDNPECYMLQAGGEYELVSEMGFLRSLIKYQGYKIVVYGAGMRADYLIRWLKMEDIPVEFIIDIDICKWGTRIHNIVIRTFDNIPEFESEQKYLVLISPLCYERESEKKKITLSLFKAGFEDYIYPFGKDYDLPPYLYERAYFYFDNNNREKIVKIYNSLSDKKSQEVYFEYIKSTLSNCVYRGPQEKTKKKYFQCYTPLTEEIFLNIGSYIGDTIFHFLEDRKEEFKKIIAVEGNKDTFNRMENNLKVLPLVIRNKIETNCLFFNGKIETKFVDKKITLINMDIEGAELEVLEGLKGCIIRNRPVLAISSYHKAEDILELPQFIYDTVEDYNIYFRKYAAPYQNHLENGELVMYAVPKERSKYSVKSVKS